MPSTIIDNAPADGPAVSIIETDDLIGTTEPAGQSSNRRSAARDALFALRRRQQHPKLAPMSIRYGTLQFDVLGYSYEFAGEITTDEIATQVGKPRRRSAIVDVVSMLRRRPASQL